MEFAFTDEQQMIRDTAAAFLAEAADAAAVRAAMESERGFDEAFWQRIAGEMCWTGIHVPEQYGGLGLGCVELAIVMEQMGRFLACAPFFSSVCLGANALLAAADEAQKARWLPGIADGSVRATLGWCGSAATEGPEAVQATARAVEGGYELAGDWRYVVDGHTAELLILAARLPGSSGSAGIGLFAVPAGSEGLAREWLPTLDQTRKLAAIHASGVRVPADALLGGTQDAWPALARALDLATVALAAEQSGGAQQVLEMAVAYTKERKQFGRAIASFQAIKHKAADMMLKAECSQSAVWYAACVAQDVLEGALDDAALAEAASVAKAYCSETYFHNAGSAIQMFGGVGFTWEYDVQLYFKRARASESFLGDGSQHRERIARGLGLCA